MHTSIATVCAVVGAAAAADTRTPSMELPTPAPPSVTFVPSVCGAGTASQMLYISDGSTDCAAADQCKKDACDGSSATDKTDLACFSSFSPTLSCANVKARVATYLSCAATAAETCTNLPLAKDTSAETGSYMNSNLYKSCDYLSCSIRELSMLATTCDVKGHACTDPSTTDNSTTGNSSTTTTDATTDATTDGPSVTSGPTSGAASVATVVVGAFATMALLL